MIMRHAIVFSVLVFVACGKSSDTTKPTGGSSAGSSSGTQPAAALSGSWSGSWTRTKPTGGGGELVLTIGANTTLRRVGTACPPEETPATVTVSGDRVTIDVSTEDVKATYSGTRSGNEMSGELTTTCKLGTGTGTWKLTAH